MDDLIPITRTERLLDGEDLTPTNREEMFIKRIYDKTQEVPEPVNRKEYFLKKAGEAGGDVTVVPLSVTDNGIYSEEGKAYSPVTVEVEPPEDSYQLKSITTPTSLATFEASAMPMPSLKVSVEAKQEGSGTPSPENVRPISGWSEVVVSDVGKNLLDPNVLTLFSSNRYIATINYNIQGAIAVKPNTPYCISFTSTLIIGDGKIIFWSSSGTQIRMDDIRNKTTFTTPSNCVSISFYAGQSSSQSSIDDFEPQLEIGETATEYEPYNGTTTTITLPQTVYGGEVDVVNGTSGNKLTYDVVDLGDLTWSLLSTNTPNIYRYQAVINDMTPTTNITSSEFEQVSAQDTYRCINGICAGDGIIILYDETRDTLNTTEFRNAISGVQLRYPLATPTTFETQPTPIKSLNGTNNLSVDCGEVIEGEYFKALGGE